MKKILHFPLLLALLVAIATPAARATIFFTDNFSNGSTTNGPSVPGGTPTASFTSYDIASTKNTISISTTPPTNGVSINPGELSLRLLAATTAAGVEAQALFTNSPVALTANGDYIDIAVVFTNAPWQPTNYNGTLLANSGALLWIGLFNSAGAPPVAGGLANSGLGSGATFTTGNCANWYGYVGSIASNSTCRIYTRPVQNGASPTAAVQDLLGDNAGTGFFNNPRATNIVSVATPAAPVILASNGIYTLYLKLTMIGVNTMSVTNTLYSGAGTGGTVVYTLGTNSIVGNTYLTSAFDGFAIGAFSKGVSINPCMDITSIQITGQVSPPVPPTISSQPVPVIVATNGSCFFSVSATGAGLTYQWHRNGTNLLNGPNISGATGTQLFVSPAGTNDALSAANGYYVTVTGAGNLSTNSVTNSLTLIPATNLYYASGSWDLHNSSSWDTSDSGSQKLVFDYGDPVNFADNGGGTVTLNGPYLSAASVTVSQSSAFLTWTGPGSFAGPGNLIYSGSAQFTINNANIYSGGTIISNASANLRLVNYNGLGAGPVTLALGGPKGLELTTSGSASSGVVGDVIVANDFTIQYDGLGAFAAVFLSNLSGTSGKMLTIVPSATVANTTTNNRVRVYGGNTTYDANLFLNDPLLTFASYNSSGSQTYNGVISGPGAFMEKGTITYFNGANTYSGGTFPVSATIGLGIDSVGNVSSGPIGTGPLLLTIDSTTTLTGSGQVLASGGPRTIANPIQFVTGTNNLTLVIGGTNNLTFTGPFTLNGNDLITTNSFTNRIVQITNTALTTFSGVISDLTNGVSAAYGLTITGNGTNATGPLALNNTETYTGPTVVSGGTLQVNGSLNAASAVTVSSNATLAGTGTIYGPVTVNAGGALAPGAASIGTLNINNNLILSGNINVRVNRSGFVRDKAVVSGALTNAGTGTVTVTNLGLALQVGDTFTLFNKPLTNGAALTVTGAGMSWVNNLAIDGSIAVLGTFVLVPTNSARITGFSLASGNVVVSGTNGQSGGTYYLLASTNVAKLLSQWTTVATNVVNTNGAAGAFTFTGTNVASPGAAQQFYILSNTNN